MTRKNFSHRRRVLLLMLTMAITIGAVATFSIVALYRAAFNQQRDRLVKIVRGEAALIEELFQAGRTASSAVPLGEVLNQVVDSIARSGRWSRRLSHPCEFALIQRASQGVVVLYDSSLPTPVQRDPIPFGSILAAPMQRALFGSSGVEVLTDIQGRSVLAAYQPVGSLGLGVVGRIEMSEVHCPFIQAGILTGVGACVFLFLGWVLLRQVSNPVLSELEESEKKYRTLFDSSTEAVYIGSSVIEDCNQQACQVLGRSREEMIGRSILEFSPPVQACGRPSAEVAKVHREGLKNGKARHFEWQYLRPDSSIVEADVVMKPIQLGGRELRLVTARDVTARKVAEKQLHKLSRAIEQHPTAILLLGSDFRIEYVNPRFTQLTGYSVEEATGKHPRFLTAEEGFHQYHEQAEKTLLEGRSWRGEFLNRRKDGTLFWSEVTMCPLRDAQGKVTHFLEVNDDITERKRKDEALRLTQFTVDRATEAVYWIDKEGRILYANEAACNRLGYQKDELLGSFVYEIAVDSSAQTWAEDWNLLKNRGYHTEEAIHRKKDGTLFPNEIAVSYLEFGEHQICCAFVRDISERKHLEEQIRQFQKMEAIGQLAGGIAHDFNNLLTGINGYADLLLERLGPDDPMSQDVAAIKSFGDRASLLTRQLLAFSRKQVIKPAILDLNAAILEMEKMLGRLIGEDIQLEIVCDPEAGRIEIDPGQLEQLFLNLAVNSRDAMPEGGGLRIATERQVCSLTPGASREAANSRGRVLITVSDTGCGIDESIQQRIFEPFFTTKEVGKGTGLGLSTVYGIVRQSQGTIEVQSKPGQGTTFLITFPVVEQKVEDSCQKNFQQCRGNETILLVEDEPTVKELACRILERSGFQVLVAADPTDAIEISAKYRGKIDLLLTDVVMPVMNGQQMAERILEKRPAIKVVFMTGYTENATLSKISCSGALILQKPFDSATLVWSIRKVLDGRV